VRNPMAADRFHIAAKNWASGARRLRQNTQEGQEDAIRTCFEYAIDYERSALRILLDCPYASETLVLDCYKFAAVYSLDAGNPQQAKEFLNAALERDPSDRFRRELEGLLCDANRLSSKVAESQTKE
jgi:tetratricopeptide (TPR) repeat protein